MKTYYIIVNRATGELYNGNNVSRFYDLASSARGQTDLRINTVLEVTIDGPSITAEQLAEFSSTEAPFKAGIKELVAEEQTYVDGLVLELETETDLTDRYEVDWLKSQIKMYEKGIEELKALRYADLAWA